MRMRGGSGVMTAGRRRSRTASSRRIPACRWALATTVGGAVLAAATVAHAGSPGPWTQVTDAGGTTIDEVALARGSDSNATAVTVRGTPDRTEAAGGARRRSSGEPSTGRGQRHSLLGLFIAP